MTSLDRKSSSNSMGGGSTPALTRHSSAVSMGSSNVRVRNRSATRFEAFKKDVLSLRLSKYRAIATMPHLRVENDIVTEVIDPALSDDAQLKFVDMANHDTRLIVVTTTHFLVFNYKNSRPRSVSTMQMEQAGANQSTAVVPTDYNLSMSFPISEIATIYDSAIDDKAVFIKTVTPSRMSQRDMEARLFIFSQSSQRDAFEAHLLSLVNAELLDLAATARGDLATSGHPVGSGVMLVVWDSILKGSEDVRRNLSAETKSAGGDGASANAAATGSTTLETCETDYLYITTSREAMCAKLRAQGETKVLFSSDVALSDNTHDVVVLCDTALYTGKQRKEHKIRYRVPYDAIESVVVDSKLPQLVLKLDFAKVTIRGDMTMLFPSQRNRDVFITVLSSAYEAAVVDRLSTSVEEDVFWSKRGLIESQLIRFASAIKTNRFTRALGGEQLSMSPGMSASEMRASKWLLYTFRHHTTSMVTALSSAGIPAAELDFIARCTFAVFDECNWIEPLLRKCVQHALALRDGDARAASFPVFSEPGSFSAAVLQHYVAQCGEQYVQVVLAQLIERFIDDPMSNTPMLFAASMEEWLGRFVRSVLENNDGDILADEIKILIALIHERSFAAVRQSPNSRARAHTASPDGISRLQNSVDQESVRSIGNFFFSKLIQPALTNPLSTGVLVSEPTPTQMENLSRIALVLEGVFGANANHVLETKHGAFSSMGELDKKELAKWAASQVDPVRDCLKSFIYSDMVSTDRPDGVDGADSGVPLFVPSEEDTHQAVVSRRLAFHVDRNVSLERFNPKLLHALGKAIAPYYSAVLAQVSIDADRGGPTAGVSSSRSAQPADAGGNKAGAKDTTANEFAVREAAVRAEMDVTVRQLTHEVLELRRQLEVTRAEASRTTTLALRLQEELALSSRSTKGSKKPISPDAAVRAVTFAKMGGAKPNPLNAATSSDSDSSSSDSDDVVPASPMRLKRAASGVIAVNPLPITTAKNGLSPAMQEYHRSLMEVSPPAALEAVPLKSRVFGCPLDTYVIGRGPLQPKDVEEL